MSALSKEIFVLVSQNAKSRKTTLLPAFAKVALE